MNTTETTTVDDTADGNPETGTSTQEPTTDESTGTPEVSDDKLDPASRDAVKYRKRAQAAEKERDQLADRLATLQRAEVERLAAQHLADGADIWRDGADLANLLTDAGNIDPDKVKTTATELGATHPHWRKLAPSAPPASSVTANGKIGGDEPKQTTWSDLLQGRNSE